MINAAIKRTLNRWGVDVSRRPSTSAKDEHLYEKYRQFTMIPRETFLANLRLARAYSAVEGDFVECGVWRGGMAAALAEVLGPDRVVHLFDSFEGLPPATELDGAAAMAWQRKTDSPGYFDNCTADETHVSDAMRLARHDKVRLHKGWFRDTLPAADTSRIAILRLDGDWYESIAECLEWLHPKVVLGGLVIVDDYHTWDGCTRAVHDYLSKIGSRSRLAQWDNGPAYWVKRDPIW